MTQRESIGSGPRSALAVAIALLLPLAAEAGDILRGGARANGRPRGAAPDSPNPVVVEQARVNARDSLARSTKTIQAMQAMQQAARGMAARSGNSVPNGLGTGGLKVAPGATANSPLWRGANLPRQTVKNGQTDVVIKQLTQQALLNWETFNIGKQTTLTFDQSAGGKSVRQWVAVNKINDPTGKPSQILGQIKADGQVYVLNQNGILFGGSSQVNTHALVASSLPINGNLLSAGLLNNPDAQFLFSALEIPALSSGTMPAFTPPAPPNTPGGRIGDVIVEKGARLSAPTSADKVGGRIALVGPNVLNEGTISTPDGQTILAAGLQVGFAAHAGSDPSLRGLDVFVGKVRAPAPEPTPEVPEPVAPPAYAGTATNAGLIDAPRANVTMAGKLVEQLGAIQSSTSVALNGRIDLQASFNATSPLVLGVARFAPGATGTVRLGAGSVTAILPELFSDDTIANTRLPIASEVNIEGKAIHLGAHAQLLAPNAHVTLRAGHWLPLNGATAFVAHGGQIYLDGGASINVAGTPDVLAAMAQNILTLQLRGSELADSPLQRDGLLRGLSLNLDMRQGGVYNGLAWLGTPLGDATGFVNLIERNAAQLTTAGGSVKLTAGGSVVLQRGSLVDVSGGWTNFEGGFVETTRVISGGRLYDISDATPDRIYSGIYRGETTFTSAKWGASETFAHPLALSGRHWEDAYTKGGDGGSIVITAPAMALDGDLRGLTISGPRQREIAPAASAVSFIFQAQDASTPAYLSHSPTPPKVVFRDGTALPAAEPFAVDGAGEPAALRPERLAKVELSPELLTHGGFGALTVDNGDGGIVLPGGVSLSAQAGGRLTLIGANIDIRGDIIAPGGQISLTALNISPGEFLRLKAQSNPPPETPAPNAGRGHLSLAAGSTLSTAGLIVDERAGADSLAQPLALAGGAVTLTGYDVKLAAGSLVDVSGGLRLDATGTKTFGSAGSIAIKAGQDANLLSVLGGELTLASELRGFSGGRGAGALAVQASLVQVGGSLAPAGTLHLAPEFFSTGGFANYTITGLGAATGVADQFRPAVLIVPGAILAPVAQSWLAIPHPGAGEGAALLPFLQPLEGRPSVSLTIQAPGVQDTFTSSLLVRGDVILGEGARIETGPLASVNLTGQTVSVLGSIIAPGGAISISGGRDSTRLFSEQGRALSTVYVGPGALLSARGATVFTSNLFGHRTGAVLPGGSIALNGNLATSAGAVFEVSGASDVLDFTPAYVGGTGPLISAASGLTQAPFGTRVVARQIDSDAGRITLSGGQGLQSDATLLALAGGPNALGGALSISSGRFYPPAGGSIPTPLDVTLQVTQTGQFASGVTSVGSELAGFGKFAVQQFQRGGFDALELKGTVSFSGPVSIDARRELFVADAGILYADAAVQLAAPYVKLGTPFLTPLTPEQQLPPFTQGGVAFPFKPATGAGHLSIRAGLLDIGNLSLQNIHRADFLAEGGEIRGAGTLDIAGDLTLRAALIYPPSALTFTIAASEKNIAVMQSAQGGTAVTLASAILPPGFGIGSPLLGSTVQSIDGATVTLASGANASIGQRTLAVYAPGSGSVTIEGSGARPLPLSAGGQLNIFGSTIVQSGTLVAPLGGITLGWDGTGTAPRGAITGENVAVTQRLTLAPGSLTSVSAIDPLTGVALTIPYGLILNDVSWIDPRGIDITGGGGPRKTVTLAGANVIHQAGATVDVRGGGDLFAYRWVRGTGGSRDLLASATSFAVIPDFAAGFAPIATFNPAAPANTLGGDTGYANTTLKVGDRIYLQASEGLAAGYYTLLPARYAIMEGAFLVTPKTGGPIGTFQLADGSSFVSGYRMNGLSAGHDGDALNVRFEVASGEVVRQRAEYEEYFANAFLLEGAKRLEAAIPRLPGDAGHLIFQAGQSATLAGHVLAEGASSFRAGLVDIASSSRIVVNNGERVAGALTLDAARLNSFGAESLLIGGIRTFGDHGAAITVRTGEVTVDNAGSPLRAPEIILVAKEKLTIADGAIIQQSGLVNHGGSAGTLRLTGDGVLVRVSSDPGARTVRTGLITPLPPTLSIGAHAHLLGANILLDSTANTTLDPTAILRGDSISLNSGRISVLLDGTAPLPAAPGLVLGGKVLEGLRGADRLSLLSYSTLDLYGAGTLRVAGALELHASDLRGFETGGGTARIDAGSLLLDNSAGVVATTPPGAMSGTLELNAGAIRLGAGVQRISQYESVLLNAPNGLLVQGKGGLNVQGGMTATTPFVTGAKSAEQTITTGGALQFLAPAGPPRLPATAGLGASVTLHGASVRVDSSVLLPSGLLSLHATTGDVIVNGLLNTAGTAQTFHDLIRYTGAGGITLRSDAGSITLGEGSIVNVAAAGNGPAGFVEVSAAHGTFTLNGALRAAGGGSFSLDIGSLPDLSTFTPVLAAGGFTREQLFRVRTGDVLIAGTRQVEAFKLSADLGSITVTGTIDASGRRGGLIALAAGRRLTLEDGALLTVAAQEFDAAGKGGDITLETRGLNGGMLDLLAGSTLDLSVAAKTATSAAAGNFSGTLHLRAPQTSGGTDLALNHLASTINGASRITVEGFHVIDLTGSGLITAQVQEEVRTNGLAFGNGATSARLLLQNAALEPALVITSGAEIINSTGDLTLGASNSTAAADWNLATFRFGPKNAAGVLTLRAAGNLVFFNALSDGFATSAYNSALLAHNPLLPANAQSWSYRLAAGADLTAADFSRVLPLSSLAGNSGSLLLGKNAGAASATTPGPNAQTARGDRQSFPSHPHRQRRHRHRRRPRCAVAQSLRHDLHRRHARRRSNARRHVRSAAPHRQSRRRQQRARRAAAEPRLSGAVHPRRRQHHASSRKATSRTTRAMAPGSSSPIRRASCR